MSSVSPAHTITLDVPDALYERVRHAAETLKRRLEDVLLEAAATALPPLDDLPRDVADDLSSFPFMNDAALFAIARSTMAREVHAEMTALLDRKGSGDLDEAEQRRLDELVHAHEVHTLRRAQAAALLQRRGYDMSQPPTSSALP